MTTKDSSTRNPKQILAEYFDLVDSYFGGISHHLGEDADAHIALGKISNYALISDLVLDSIDDVGEAIDAFWKNNFQSLQEFIIDQSVLKCVYSGDLSPVSLETFVKKAALYVDTVIIPDPLLNISYYLKPNVYNKKFYLEKIVRHIFNIWAILVVCPINLELVTNQEKESLIHQAHKQKTTYLSELFDREFEHQDALNNFLDGIKTTEGFFKVLRQSELLPVAYRSPSSLENNLLRPLEVVGKQFRNTFGELSIGAQFARYAESQFVRVKEHRFFCELFHAEPIYDHQPAWAFWNYEMGGSDMDAAIINALQYERFEWIGNLPIAAIRALREQQELEYMRQVLRQGIFDIKARADKDLTEIVKQLQENFNLAFDRQKSEMATLHKKVRQLTRQDIPITTFGAILGFIPVIGNYLSLPFTGRDLIKAFNEYRAARQLIKANTGGVINLLLKSYDDNQ